MTDIQTFQNTEFGQIRVMEIDGAFWFVAVDVCKALELGNPTQAVSRLDDDEHFTTLISNESAVGKSKTNVITESGLYSLVLSSRKPEAKAFKRWITSEVLPSIRKTGSYSVQQTQTALPTTIEIRREPREAKSKSMVIRINAEAADIIETLCAETRKPTSQVASELIIKAFPLVQVTD